MTLFLKHRLLSLVRSLILGLFCLPLGAQAESLLAQKWKPHWAELQFQYGRFHSTANFNSEGQIQGLTGMNAAWTNTQLLTDGRYYFSDNFALKSGLSFSSSQREGNNNAVTTAGLQNIYGGMEILIRSKYLDILLEGFGSVSLFQANQNATAPLLGDGAHTVGGRLWTLIPTPFFEINAAGGYLYRTDGLSQLVPYYLGIQIPMDSLTLKMAIDGSWTVGPDAEPDAYRFALTNQANGGSLAFRSPNPSSTEVIFSGELKATEQFSFYGGLSSSVAGANSANGTRFFVGLNLIWQTMSSEPKADYPWQNPSASRTQEIAPTKADTPKKASKKRRNRKKN